MSFDESVIAKARRYADKNNINLSRLVEFLLQKVTGTHYHSLEDYPVSEWVCMVAEGPAEYKTKNVAANLPMPNTFLPKNENIS